MFWLKMLFSEMLWEKNFLFPFSLYSASGILIRIEKKYQLDEADFEVAAAGVDGRLFITGGPDERKLVCLRPTTPPLSSSIISLLA